MTADDIVDLHGTRDVLDRGRPAEDRMVHADSPGATGSTTANVVHLAPVAGEGTMRCCGRTPFEVPRGDRITTDPAQVACPVLAARNAEQRAACLEVWPEAEAMAYNPACCRFPKSCSIPGPPAPEPSDRAGLSEIHARIERYRHEWLWQEADDDHVARWGTHIGQMLYRLPKDGQTTDMQASIESMLADLSAVADRLAVAEQAARAAHDRANDWMGAAAAREDALRAAEQEAATLRAQRAALTTWADELAAATPAEHGHIASSERRRFASELRSRLGPESGGEGG